ncbi:Rieske [2Fe-2S] domain-containing protein [Chondrocystis sp. NIES-4102]|nr:Rieske [2Fe-2S] domain-containing protein [Chondrocystis sp. NIES-4102]
MKRREFTGFVGIGVGMSIVPAALTACNSQSQNQATPNTTSLQNGFQPVGNVSQLEQKGQILSEELKDKKVLVIRDPENNQKLIAVNPTCPHAGCTVGWESDTGKFICPCHDSEFGSNGEVLTGPATEALANYEVKLEGDSILVKIG